jgi:hypothetical protein
MPYCRICGYEYSEGVARCPDCDVDLVSELRSEDQSLTEQEFVKVYVAADEMEAKIVTSALESAGIRVWDRSQVIHSLKWVTVGPLAPEDLLVLESDVEKARAVLRKALSEGRHLPTAEE